MNIVFLSENGLGPHGFIQDRAAAEKLQRSFASARFKFVDAAQDPLTATLRHIGHGIVFVVQRDVVEKILALLIHPPHAVLNNDGYFVDVGRVVGRAGWDGAGEHQTVPILMLQPLARKRSSTSRTSQQKALAASIRKRPDGVTDALESEH